MRLCRYADAADPDGPGRCGLVEDDRVAPIDAPTLLAVAAGAPVRVVGAPGPLADARLLAPLRPGKIIGIGLNYRAHAAETGARVPERPLLFHKFSSAVAPPGGPVAIPAYTAALDYEGELAVVIGRRAAGVAEADALAHVLGYAVVDDITARDLQQREPQWVLAKSGDGFAPLGPWITTADEVPDPQDLRIRTWVSGELRQDGHTGDMVFGVAALIADISARIALDPGDVIITGTPAGVGIGSSPPRFLSQGDVVRVEISRLGAIEHRLVAP